ncbi:ABC transporter permease [Halocatena pleomorpha]|uniref:ABC transporter permease n=1 Tax=Halocatena pleomorpha TaxID=1785090 RepID=A0A3P3RIP6_9EURY|nr:ABC transporter permease [Halocatena pleomorpha]RRJ33406.1 ABC transporter permease [Halocatena pleomorpha]
MSWTVVAQKDFRDAGRSKTLWAVSLLFVLFATGAAIMYAQIPALQQAGANSAISSLGFVNFLQGPVTILVPVIGLMLGYKAISGEVENGSVKLLLSLPHRRSSVVAGKFVGRVTVLAVSIIIGFAVATAVMLALYPELSPGRFALFVLLAVLFGAAYVSIGIGFSALTKSTTKAGAGIFGVYLLFNWLWGTIGMGVDWFISGTLFFRQGVPDWYLLYTQLNPNSAFRTVLGAALSDASVNDALTAQPGDPFFLSAWFALLILIAWVVLPAALGTLRFRSVDL